jgi:hypothetical protein
MNLDSAESTRSEDNLITWVYRHTAITVKPTGIIYTISKKARKKNGAYAPFFAP